MTHRERPWWQNAVIYQIYPRSFADGNGDGVGDLPGMLARLDYLAWLGVEAVWISPFYKSPMHDFGYDVSDHCDVDPLFGTLHDFDAVLARAHALGMRVMIDFVPSHTSHQHPWFIEALSDRRARTRSFYIFRDPASDGGPPNGWRAAFPPGAPAWTLDAASGQYYLHSFLPQQPDLDWSNPEVAEAMQQVLRFWLDRGVDGFRADVIHNLVKDLSLAESPEMASGLPCMLFNDQPGTHARLREIRRLLDSYDGDRAMVGEVFLLDSEKVASYYGNNDELHMCFDFMLLYSPWDAASYREQIERVEKLLSPRGAWPAWVLNNHDQKRIRTRLDGSEARSRAAAVLLLTLRGTPFLYMGEELGLEDAIVSEAERLDPGGRDGCRAPLPWTTASDHGWPARPWLPFPPQAAQRSVQAQTADADSILHLYRRLLAARRASPALRSGAFRFEPAPADVLAYSRLAGDEHVTVWINFCDQTIEAAPADPARRVLVATDRASEGERFSGRLSPYQAVVVR